MTLENIGFKKEERHTDFGPMLSLEGEVRPASLALQTLALGEEMISCSSS